MTSIFIDRCRSSTVIYIIQHHRNRMPVKSVRIYDRNSILKVSINAVRTVIFF
jgi:hypothetical protein